MDGHYSTIDTARRTVDEHHQVGADVIRRSRIGFDRRAAAVVRRRRLDGHGPRGPPLRQVRRVGSRGQRVEGDETDRRRRGADRVPQRRHRSRRGTPRPDAAAPPGDVRRLDEEVGLRAARRGPAPPQKLLWMDKSVSRLAKAKHAEVYHYVVQGFDDSPDAFVGGAGLQASQTSDDHQSVPVEVRLGPRGARRVHERERAAAPGRAAVSGRIRTRQEVPDDRARLREGSDGLHRYVAPSEREYYNVIVFHEPRATSSSSRTSCFARASRGCRWSNACVPPLPRSCRRATSIRSGSA